MKQLFKILFVLVLILVVSNQTWAQCAMCRATVNSNLSEGRGVIGTGINFGILYLLLTPYILVGTLVFLWYRNGKKELANKLAIGRRIKEIYKS
ncbi:hypothetical protein SAMN06298216_2530 [Spirosomataceae bacterium TFI 002]|nr:hypothetical protein SAMN06298216_2530 [Spirosomataceae bacterium TFI 002]